MYQAEFQNYRFDEDERLVCIRTEIAFLDAVIEELEWVGQCAERYKKTVRHLRQLRNQGHNYVPTF